MTHQTFNPGQRVEVRNSERTPWKLATYIGRTNQTKFAHLALVDGKEYHHSFCQIRPLEMA